MGMDTTAEVLTGPRPTLRRGMWLAWALVALYAAYIGVLLAGGVLSGVPADPSLAIAEVLTIVGAVLQVFFVAVIHECAPRRRRTMTLVALGWMFVLAGLTLCVHFFVAGVLAASEWTASRLWSRCRAVNGRSAVEVERALRREGVVVPVRCERDDAVLDCRWRSLMGAGYRCAYEVRDGEATLLEGSG